MIRAENPHSDTLPSTLADPHLMLKDTDRVHLLGTLVGPDGRVAFLRGSDGRVEQVVPGDAFGSGVVAGVDEGHITMDYSGEIQSVFLNDKFGN